MPTRAIKSQAIPPIFDLIPRILSTASLLSLATCFASEWQAVAPLPATNGGFAAGAAGDRVIVAGGTNWEGGVKNWLDTIWMLDPAANTWAEAGRLGKPVAYAAAATGSSTLWIASGSDGSSTHRFLWKVAADGTVGEGTAIDQAVVYASCALLGDSLYVIGGGDDQDKLDRLTNEFWRIDTRTGRSRRLADYPEPGLFVGAATACGGRILVFGGGRWNPATSGIDNMASAHAYSPETGEWTTLPPMPEPNRGLAVAALDDRHIYIGGGYIDDERGFTDRGLVFDTKTGRYCAGVPIPYKAAAGLVVAGEWLYCLGGEDMKMHRTDKVYRIAVKAVLGSAH